jgi:hypothetical protein
MEIINNSKGLAGFNSSLLKLIQKILKEKDERRVVFVGCTGICIPLTELIIFGLRGIRDTRFFYILNAQKDNTYEIEFNGLEFDWRRNNSVINAEVVVLLGGLTIPKFNVTPKDVNNLIEELSPDAVIGASGSNVFSKSGWLEKVRMDYLIDMSINVATYRLKE